MKSALPHYWWNNQIHISWFITWSSVAILIGIAISPITNSMFADISWVIVGCLLMGIVLTKRKRYYIFIAIITGLLFGVYRGSAAYSALTAYRPYIGKHITIVGIVSEDTSFGPTGDLRLRLNSVEIGNHILPGSVWVSTNETTDIKRGDVVTLSGMLGKGFGNIPASLFKAKVEQIERPNPGDVGRRVRDWFGEGVHQSMSPEDANLAMAYLVGQKLSVSETLADQLKTVGLIHAVVASGAQLTILVGVARKLFVKLSKYLSTLFAGMMIIGFILITGFSPSMSRAGLVSGLSLAAWYYGRVINPVVLLSFSAAVTALIKPEYIWGDIGWYLSFAAFTGVIVVAPLINQYFWGKRHPSIIREILIATIAAQLVTLPLVVHAFGYYSAYAILANLLVVPLIPLTMLLTFVSGLVGLIAPSIASTFGMPVSIILQYMRMVINWITHLPGAKTTINFTTPLMTISYVGILLVIVYLWRSTGYDFRSKEKAEKLL